MTCLAGEWEEGKPKERIVAGGHLGGKKAGDCFSFC